jgi:GNAT superfamily N-acetyltransferase
MNLPRGFEMRHAREGDVSHLFSLIQELAEYERLKDQMSVQKDDLREALFGPKPAAEALLGLIGDVPVAYAVFFHSFSTFVGRSGLYLEDVYVRPAFRGKGIGRAMLVRLAQIAVERRCGRFEWMVLDWNEPAISFYKELGAVGLDGWTMFRLAGEPLQRLADGV